MAEQFDPENEEAVNPCPPEWLDIDSNALLRGDAIGDTAYTHRWVLQCLFTITEALPTYVQQNVASGGDDPSSKKDSNDPFQKVRRVLWSDDSSPQAEEKQKPDEIPVLELDSEVESAACQLWDMTVEKDVSLHLINLDEVDILQLTSMICDACCAPRLTEVMVGVLANLCCIEEGCLRVLKKKEDNEVLLSTLHLLGSTSDVPTLCEVMRLIRLLLYHRSNRTQNTTWAACPLLKLLCLDYYRNAITFLINNSLSGALITCVLEVLANFLFFCLPEIGLNVASLYSTEEIISGLVDIADRKIVLRQIHLQEEGEKILHLAIMCLYSFIDTPGTKIIQSLGAAPNSRLEQVLNAYMEHDGGVESAEELGGAVCDHVIHAVGVAHLLIPVVRQPSLIMTVGKLMALIRGESQQYSVSRSSRRTKSAEDTEILSLSEAMKNRIRRESAEDSPLVESRRKLTTQVSNPLVEECGWQSPPAADAAELPTPLDSTGPTDRPSQSGEDCSNPDEPPSASPSLSSDESCVFDSRRISSGLEANMRELKNILEDYCYQLVAFWWSSLAEVEKRKTQLVILDILDQCHAHEVLFILKAVRFRDPLLVPRMQEQILDSRSHPRLVALLAYMYQ